MTHKGQKSPLGNTSGKCTCNSSQFPPQTCRISNLVLDLPIAASVALSSTSTLRYLSSAASLKCGISQVRHCSTLSSATPCQAKAKAKAKAKARARTRARAREPALPLLPSLRACAAANPWSLTVRSRRVPTILTQVSSNRRPVHR
jgi:hypothetical protein